MADRYTSLIGLVLDAPVDDVGVVTRAAVEAKDLDRAYPVRDEGADAQEVHWGGRMQAAVVRRVVDDGAPLLRTETYIGADGVEHGIQRQARLLQGLARQLRGRIRGVRDLSAGIEHDEAWMHRAAGIGANREDAIRVIAEGEGTWWVRTHGAARLDVPDLELYGLTRAQVPGAEEVLGHVHDQLLRGGLTGSLTLPDGTPIYLVPVLEAWQTIPFAWPGVGKAGKERGPGLDGPRATLSVLRPPRFGRYRKDFAGVLEALPVG